MNEIWSTVTPFLDHTHGFRNLWMPWWLSIVKWKIQNQLHWQPFLRQRTRGLLPKINLYFCTLEHVNGSVLLTLEMTLKHLSCCPDGKYMGSFQWYSSTFSATFSPLPQLCRKFTSWKTVKYSNHSALSFIFDPQCRSVQQCPC